MNPDQTYTQNDESNDVDKGFSQADKDQRCQEKVPQTQQQTSKRSELSHKSQSRPNLKAASINQQLRSRSYARTNQSWISSNPFINFMYEFRKSQSGQRGTNMFQLGGEQWRHMSEDEKQPFIEAANQNKKLKQQPSQETRKKKQDKEDSVDLKQYRSRSDKNKVTNKKSNSSRKTLSPKRRKERQKHHEAELKKRRAQSDSDTDTDTSGSIHDATTDCSSKDSDNNS